MTPPGAPLLRRLALAALLLLAPVALSAQEPAPDGDPEAAQDVAPESDPDGASDMATTDPSGEQPEAAEEAGNRYDVAVLQGLDKITARISTFDAPVDGVAHFGSLEITARTCHKRPPEEPPESTVFLEIVDVRPDSAAVKVFSGWMFASSPALSAMEHPVYDVWVIDCKNAESSDSVSSEGN